MGIKVTLLNSPLAEIITQKEIEKRKMIKALAATEQNQKFKSSEIQNGYGTATTVAVSPGFGATVEATINIQVNTVSEEVFDQIVDEVKKSKSYQDNVQFKKQVDESSYTSAGSSSSGFFGWLVGNNGDNYTNSNSNITTEINDFRSGDSSDDLTVANSIANIMVENISEVSVTATVSVTGQLLVPSPTVIAVESTVFNFVQEDGTRSTVTMLNQKPLVAVDQPTGTVSTNSLEPGAQLTLSPIGG
ncbi:MAG: hypothetical protein AAF617_07045 [Bacteroidota bacterium]